MNEDDVVIKRKLAKILAGVITLGVISFWVFDFFPRISSEFVELEEKKNVFVGGIKDGWTEATAGVESIKENLNKLKEEFEYIKNKEENNEDNLKTATGTKEEI